MSGVSTDYDTAWEDINLVLQEIEREATKANRRTDILFYTYGTLEQGKHVIQMGLSSTEGLENAREGQNTSEWDGDLIELMGMYDGVEEDPNDPYSGSSADIARRYLKECFGCSFRLAFDWQLNPLSFLGPILDTVRSIMSAIKPLWDALDPMKQLEKLCDFMDQLKIFCPQDLISLIMALKALLFSYAVKGFNFKLDWTMILGPLLKAIAELLIAIIDAVLNIILAPLDCLIAALQAAADLERAGRDFAAGVAEFSDRQTGTFKKSTTQGEASVLKKEVTTQPGAKGKQVWQPNNEGLGTVQGRAVPRSEATNPKNHMTAGFEIRQGEPLDQAWKRPGWADASIMQKAVVSVTTARQHLVTLFDNLKITLDSLGNLVGGGVMLSLEIGGLLLMIFDMIGLIMMIIRMFKKVGNPKDVNWCEYLAENPEILREQLRRFYNTPEVTTTPTRSRSRTGTDSLDYEEVVSYSVVVNGKSLGEIPLCASSRDSQTQAFLDSWIKELERN